MKKYQVEVKTENFTRRFELQDAEEVGEVVDLVYYLATEENLTIQIFERQSNGNYIKRNVSEF